MAARSLPSAPTRTQSGVWAGDLRLSHPQKHNSHQNRKWGKGQNQVFYVNERILYDLRLAGVLE